MQNLNKIKIAPDSIYEIGQDKVSWFPKWDVKDDRTLYEKVRKLAHSTFDLSKFTIVGSPNITDDGVLSGINNNNRVNKTISLEGDAVVIKGAYLWNGTNPTGSSEICKIWTSSSESLTFYQKSDGKVELFRKAGGTDNYNIGSYTISANVELTYTITVVKNTSISFVAYQNGTKVIDKTVTNAIPNIFTNSNVLSFGGTYLAVTEGSIDLKQFSITVDGVPVFSGNITGIDTIKPDDYTVEGTPTISADGVATSITYENYFYSKDAITIGTYDTFDIYFQHTTPSSFSSYRVFGNNENSTAPVLYMGSDGKLRRGYGSGNTWYGSGDVCNVIYSTSTDYLFHFYSKNGLYLRLDYSTDGGKTWNNDFNISISSLTINARHYSIGSSGNNPNVTPSPSPDFSFDLNAFKIYVDGNLVYQPCLKIPYTESKTGSKIVDSIYRPRVNDMAEQFGFANYYTLDEDNGNFTLPQVELYGLIGQRTLRDSYRNGINYWELYSNRDLEQGGSCTSGVEVTFARPFADTNYVLSVPYSAKSATAFTPTQTGDWIAKGKGIL